MKWSSVKSGKDLLSSASFKACDFPAINMRKSKFRKDQDEKVALLTGYKDRADMSAREVLQGPEFFAGKCQWTFFNLSELAAATNDFNPDNLVGKGGFAEVFKGRLQTGRLIAVKKFSEAGSEEEKEMFLLTELGIVSHVNHPNTSEIIGFCVEGGLYLVFHFSQNGSLESCLFGGNNGVLQWSSRFKVALGVAHGLHYLHRDCPRRIIHRDIKASNVLLGGDFEPQICDFGLSKWLPDLSTHLTVTAVEGSFGYLAPEYFLYGYVDEKTDVFAYGVLLLELITGREAINSAKKSLVMWARPLLEEENLEELVDPKLSGLFDMCELRRIALAASLCVLESPFRRPDMSQVLRLLQEGVIDPIVVPASEAAEDWT